METAIQLVAFNVPYPPDYGGVIDIFYKVKALYESGIVVYLHCFEYNRPPAAELEKYCAKVYYYPRKKGIKFQFSDKPYILITRVNDQLLSNLSNNKAPIIFEGLHTCFYLGHPDLAGHIQVVRTHNIEHEYYENLSRAERNLFKKLFYKVESAKLAAYENVLQKASLLFCISPNDNYRFDLEYNNAYFIPAFHPFNEIKSKTGKGEYLLFHGNLSVSENIQAVSYLLKKVFPKIKFPIVIAGKNPPDYLVRKIHANHNIRLVINPGNEQMDELIQNAHICVLPTFQDTGLKLKLLASLFSGRFCVANTPMIHKTGLEHLCYLADTPGEMINRIQELLEEDFTEEEIETRKLVLEDSFSNHLNAIHIMRLINQKQTNR